MKLGDKVKDSYTGFTGTATARTEWLYGCARITIEPEELKDGKPIEPETFDEQRVEVVESRDPHQSSDAVAITGGPQDDPMQRPNPVR